MPGSVTSLNQLLQDQYGTNIACVVPDSGYAVSYRELSLNVESLAQSLSALGVARGGIVALRLGNNPKFLCAFLAIASIGAITLPINPANTLDELLFTLKDSHAQLLISEQDDKTARDAVNSLGIKIASLEISNNSTVTLVGTTSPVEQSTHASAVCASSDNDVVLMLYTSGSTSRPKLVPLTHKNLIASARNFAEWFTLSPSDTAMMIMPLFHVHGLIGITLSTWYTGGKIILPPRFSASSFWRHVQAHDVTWYSGSPTIHKILLKRADQDGAPRSVLRFIRSSSAPLAPQTSKAMEDRYDTTVIQAYGMTEAANQISANPMPPKARKMESVGISAGVEIAVLDEHGRPLSQGTSGEVCIRGDAVMNGYHNNSQANAASFYDGWFRTGDQGFFDKDGYLFISGRIKDLIIRGGENISPLEIDAVLAEHPGVIEAIAFALPDEKYGEEVYAACVLKDDTRPEDIIAHCAEHLAQFKVPKQVFVTNSLPKNALNKIQRKIVADIFAAKSF